MAAMFVSIGSIIIDDIVLPDGTTHMGVLGGCATHAVMGMRAWTDRVGIVSAVGHDFSEEALEKLAARFDLRGLRRRKDLPTPRAWQLFEADGRRTEIFRTPESVLDAMSATPETFPDSLDNLAGVHLFCDMAELPAWVRFLRSRGARVILWEPWDVYCIPENQLRFREITPLVDVFSPNLLEGRALTGLTDPVDVVRQLCEYGAPAAVLRMGAAGSLVASRDGALVEIPAYLVDPVVDVTGAGNAYCAGFVVGLARTGDLQQAGWYGGVSGSLALHQFGALYALEGLDEKVKDRLAWYQSH